MKFPCLATCKEDSSPHSLLSFHGSSFVILPYFLGVYVSVELYAFWAFLLENMISLHKLCIDFSMNLIYKLINQAIWRC